MNTAPTAAPSESRPFDGMAIASLVLGLTSVIWPGIFALLIDEYGGPYSDDMTTWIVFGAAALVPAVAAIALGCVGAYRTVRRAADYRGAALAGAGILMGVAATVVWTIVMIAGIARD